MKDCLLLLFAFLICTSQLSASIVLGKPVIQMNENEPSYIKFVGTDTESNYSFTLGTYGTEGIKFLLAIEPVDPLKTATFTQSIYSDDNYREPMFLKMTIKMAGEGMLAKKISNNCSSLTLHYCPISLKVIVTV